MKSGKRDVRAPLIDRLVDSKPKKRREGRTLRTLNREELKESVRRDLERLLNTRSTISPRLPFREDLTVVDYGLPDLTAFSPQSNDDRARLEEIITRIVSTFEPRLSNVRVAVHQVLNRKTELVAHIEAELIVDKVPEPFTFPAAIKIESGRWQVNGSEEHG